MNALLIACERAGVVDERVLQAVDSVNRAVFLPWRERGNAMRDTPIPIGHGQTTSQPSLIARMIEAMELGKDDRVLEVGTGSGYQTAILARLCGEVVSIERDESLANRARARLAGRPNVTVVVGDGTLGWPEGAPYDAITVGATGPGVPRALVEQLAEGGRLVLPVDRPSGEVLEIHRLQDGELIGHKLLPVRFVPLIGRDGYGHG